MSTDMLLSILFRAFHPFCGLEEHGHTVHIACILPWV